MDASKRRRHADEEPRPELSEEELERQKGEALPKREAMSAFKPPGWQFEPIDPLPGPDTLPPPPEE